MSLLKVENIRKSFGKTEVLKGIDFSMEKGDVVSIIGSSGSGKTTLIKLINGLLTPTSGEILIDGNKPGVETKKIVSYLLYVAYSLLSFLQMR